MRIARTLRAAGVVALVCVAGAAAASAQTAVKIGVFDPQRVSGETSEGQRIQAQLKEVKAQREKEIEDETRTIQGLQQQLEQKGLSLSEEKRTTLEIDIRRRLLELESRKDIASRGFQLEVAAAEARFNEKLRGVIAEFARNEQFLLILDAGSVAWAAPSVDVTTAVIDTFNRLHPPAPAEGAKP